jgi:DNA polymerase-3 subunit gamma/tau
MIALMRKIASAESAEITDDALALITRAAEGSARDATSLLDQAISHGAGETTADQVRAMLGLADRGRVLDLFEAIMRGDASAALAELGAQYSDGADPMAIMRDLSEITHWISVVKITPDAADDPTVSPDERARGATLSEQLAMRVLTRMWQMLLKVLDEVAQAPNSMMAAEMAIIRLTHVADLPSPEELVKKLQNSSPPPAPPSGGTPGVSAGIVTNAQSNAAVTSAPTGGPTASLGSAQPVTETVSALAHYATFDSVVDLVRSQRDVKLLVEVESCIRLVSYQPGRIEFTPTNDAPSDLSQRLGGALQRWTGARWAIILSNTGTATTIAEDRTAAEDAIKAEAHQHPLMQAAMASFPNAKIIDIRTAAEITADAELDALPEVEDEWDPFEES